MSDLLGPPKAGGRGDRLPRAKTDLTLQTHCCVFFFPSLLKIFSFETRGVLQVLMEKQYMITVDAKTVQLESFYTCQLMLKLKL